MIGIEKGISYHLSPGICVALGTITGCFGGVLRDVLLNNVPLIFHKEIYALASIIGGALFFLMPAAVDISMAYILSILVVFITRVLAVQFNWSLPKFYSR
jgi:uncharacterized membrane protein YeiH